MQPGIKKPIGPWGPGEPGPELPRERADGRAEPGSGEELVVPSCCPLGRSPAQQLSPDWESGGVSRLLPLSPDSEQGSHWTVTERQPEGRVLGNQAAPALPGDLG